MTAVILPDAEIENLVRSDLRTILSTELDQISVDVIDGKVCLRGVAHNYAAKRRAGEVAQVAAGVRDVINQLRVLPR